MTTKSKCKAIDILKYARQPNFFCSTKYCKACYVPMIVTERVFLWFQQITVFGGCLSWLWTSRWVKRHIVVGPEQRTFDTIVLLFFAMNKRIRREGGCPRNDFQRFHNARYAKTGGKFAALRFLLVLHALQTIVDAFHGTRHDIIASMCCVIVQKIKAREKDTKMEILQAWETFQYSCETSLKMCVQGKWCVGQSSHKLTANISGVGWIICIGECITRLRLSS